MTPEAGKFHRRGTLGGAGLILRMFAAIAVLVALGYWLDRLLGTNPWLLVAGIVVGVVVGIYDLVRQGRREEKRKTGAGGTESGNQQ